MTKKGGKGKKSTRGTRQRRWTEADLDTASREPRRFRGKAEGQATTHALLVERFADIVPNAQVISPYGVRAFVLFDGEETLCRVDDALTNGKTSFLAAGDRVFVERAEDEYFVRAVAPRRNHLTRPAIGKDRAQTLAANVDLLVVIAAARQPAFRPGLIDRFLIVADVGKVPCAVCLNKMDLVEAEPEDLAAYRALGVEVIPASCTTGAGIAALRRLLEGRTSVFAGHSGVGKSSLVNALDPRFDIETQTVSEATAKGRHTTTASRLHQLSGDIRIIDTPGIRQLGLWDVTPETVGLYFPEIAAAAAQCRFRDCTHIEEPGCAVRAEVESGGLSRLRYTSYLRIRESMFEDQQDALTREKAEKRSRTIGPG